MAKPVHGPVKFVLIGRRAVLRDGSMVRRPNKLRKPGNNGRKILATKVMPQFDERPIYDDSHSKWRVPYVLATGDGGVEVATFTEFASQNRHKHKTGMEIYTVLKGAMQIYIDDEGPYEVNEMEEVVILPGTVHQVVKQKHGRQAADDEFALVVRVHSINCFGDADKFVQLTEDGKWHCWEDLSDKERKKAYSKPPPA